MEELWLGDCLDLMGKIPDGSVDMIAADLPYGVTACKWDSIIPFEPLWAHYKRVIKPNGAIVLTASQPFTSALVMSNPSWFRCEWIWKKKKAKNYTQAKRHPLKYHESIIVFGQKSVPYHPQMVPGKPYRKVQRGGNKKEAYLQDTRKDGFITENLGTRYPSTILEFGQPESECLHPTQKPVALFEYLIKTYTNEGDLVLDNCAGSGTTGVACLNTNRQFILIEKDPTYYEVAKKRIAESRLSGMGE